MLPSIKYPNQKPPFPIVLLHSSMSSKSQWNRLIKRLDPQFQTIAIDLHGYGQVAMPNNALTFSLSDEIDLVHSIIDQHIEKNAPFHLIGHSYGGAIALRLALEQHNRISSLALYEPVAFYLLNSKEAAYQEITSVISRIDNDIKQNPRAATQVFIDYWSGSGTFVDMLENVQAALIEQIQKVRLDFQALLADRLQLADLHKLDIPVCLLSGRESPFSTRRIVELLSQTLPHINCHQVSGGHMAPITHATEVNNILADFIHWVNKTGTSKSPLIQPS